MPILPSVPTKKVGYSSLQADKSFLLVGGPDRPPSKRMIEQMRTEEQERRIADRQAATSPSAASASGRQEEGYWAYMQRQVQERTENLNIMGDSMDRLEDTSTSYANDVNKYVGKQKKKAVMSRTSFPNLSSSPVWLIFPPLIPFLEFPLA